MDIRVVSESIFDIESDCILYFVDNAFSNDDTMEIISKAGNRLLDVFSKLSSLGNNKKWKNIKKQIKHSSLV